MNRSALLLLSTSLLVSCGGVPGPGTYTGTHAFAVLNGNWGHTNPINTPWVTLSSVTTPVCPDSRGSPSTPDREDIAFLLGKNRKLAVGVVTLTELDAENHGAIRVSYAGGNPTYPDGSKSGSVTIDTMTETSLTGSFTIQFAKGGEASGSFNLGAPCVF